jgi:class 3 adenylate cyclase
MDVVVWLRSLGLEQYEAVFRENAIDGSVLPDLTDQDLEKLGVLLGHRRKLLRALASLETTAKAAPGAVGAPVAMDASPRDTAERRQVTVMFSDLVGSTALSTRMDPEDLRELISAYQKCVAETVQRFGGKPSGCKPMPENVAVDTTSPINIGVLANALFYYRCTDYDDQVKTVLNEASAWVAARAPGVDKPAIVLDIDETSLSNWEQIYHNKFGYVPSGACDLKAQSACGQRDWELSAQATAIGPTLDLFNFAQKLKGKNGEPVAIFFRYRALRRSVREIGDRMESAQSRLRQLARLVHAARFEQGRQIRVQVQDPVAHQDRG